MVGANSVRIEPAAVGDDIARYLHATLENEPKLWSFPRKAKSLITSEIETESRKVLVKSLYDICLIQGKDINFTRFR